MIEREHYVVVQSPSVWQTADDHYQTESQNRLSKRGNRDSKVVAIYNKRKKLEIETERVNLLE